MRPLISPEIVSGQKNLVERETSKDIYSFLQLRSRPSFSTAKYKKEIEKNKRIEYIDQTKL